MNEGISSTQRIAETHRKHAKWFTDKGNDEMTIETFYKLLMSEMSNQDPLDPMSNTEFISQMASFTALQVQQEALYYNNANYAQSLVGKTVITANSTGKGVDVNTGVVSSVNLSGGSFTVTVNGVELPLKNIMEVIDSNGGTTLGSDGAYATSLIGKYVTVAYTTPGGRDIIEEGLVDRIEINNGEISVILGGLAYPLYGVAKVESAESALEAAYKDKISSPGGGHDPDIWYDSNGIAMKVDD